MGTNQELDVSTAHAFTVWSIERGISIQIISQLSYTHEVYGNEAKFTATTIMQQTNQQQQQQHNSRGNINSIDGKQSTYLYHCHCEQELQQECSQFAFQIVKNENYDSLKS